MHLKIRGQVQGVFFRATARKIAERNNLKGWIKNKSDGGVEAVVTGRKQPNPFIHGKLIKPRELNYFPKKTPAEMREFFLCSRLRITK